LPKSGKEQKTFSIDGDSWTRECTFFVDKDKVDEKKAQVKIFEVSGGKETVIAECEINLSQHLG
jgi:hypothetical protein